MSEREREDERSFLRQDTAVRALRTAGVVGAGGAGFPVYAKWQRADEVSYLLVNHQESEPNSCVDKRLGRRHADQLAALFDRLQATVDAVIVGAKWADRKWLAPLEQACPATIYQPSQLPLNPRSVSEVAIAYTESTYEYGMEGLLLRVVADTVIGRDLPIEHRWIVQNTETLLNIAGALAGDPVVRTHLHVDGYLNQRRLPNRLFEVPVGTPVSSLFTAAGIDLPPEAVLVDGGPGWGFETSAERGVGAPTNCLLALDPETVAEHRYENGRIDVRGLTDWTLDDPPTPEPLAPPRVRVPTLPGDRFDGAVAPAAPTVNPGASVATGDRIADPTGEACSVARHAPIDGEVTAVTDGSIEICRR